MYKAILERNPSIRSANVLIVDDTEIGRKIFEKIFSKEEFVNLHFANDGNKALKLCEELNPDIIFVDIFMPNMNGLELLKRVRSNRKFEHIPIIVQTSSTDSKDINKAFELGASDVVSKPIQATEILARATFHLENIMFRRRIDKELDAARELQTSMMPTEEEIETIEKKYDLQLASYFQPCSELGGDFWGAKKVSHSELGVYTVDISGHGVAAALNTFRIQSLLSDANNFFSSTSIFLKKLNKRLVGLMPVGQFATMFYGLINTGENYIQYSSAASPGGIVVKNNGSVEILKASGFPLGIEESAEYDVFEAKFNKGEALVLFSDALIETANSKGKFFTQDDVNSVLAANKDSDAKDMLKNLLKKFKDHVGSAEIKDDLTINIYKRT